MKSKKIKQITILAFSMMLYVAIVTACNSEVSGTQATDGGDEVTIMTQKDDVWNAALLEPAGSPIPPDGILFIAPDGFLDDTVTISFTNLSGKEWGYGEHFSIDVLLDDVWYKVPPVSGNWEFNDNLNLLQDGETASKSYDMTLYGDLPQGTYRFVTEGLFEVFTVPAEAGACSDIEFYFQNVVKLQIEPLQILDENIVGSIIYSSQLATLDCTQGYYRTDIYNNDIGLYSYVEIAGVKYDIGQVAYEFDEDFELLDSSYTLQHCDFWSASNPNSDVFQLYKVYGSNYDAYAYYKIENGIPYFVTEIVGVTAYIEFNYDNISVVALSTDRNLPYTEWTISVVNIRKETISYTVVNQLLGCDSVDFNFDDGFFHTYYKPQVPSNDPNQAGILDAGCVYSFDNRVFRCQKHD